MRHLLSAVALFTALVFPSIAGAEPIERPTISVSLRGEDLQVVVHNVTDYCVTNGDTSIVRTSDSIRILRDRPTKVSRCLETRDLTFVVPKVDAGRYTITYERLPLVAPVRWMQVASTTTVID